MVSVSDTGKDVLSMSPAKFTYCRRQNFQCKIFITLLIFMLQKWFAPLWKDLFEQNTVMLEIYQKYCSEGPIIQQNDNGHREGY